MILSFSAEHTERDIQKLADLLIDAVDSGASVGFMPPLTESEALDYWRGVMAAMRNGARILLVAAEGDLIQGSVQLDLETRANGRHRAEAIKLFVHRRARRQGLAKALMAELESTARNMGRTLLLTDTRKGGDAEKMCEALGFVKFGEVPNYARTGDGRLNTSSFFYKEL
jgi:GNAT superfamily N-acetyltransferase